MPTGECQPRSDEGRASEDAAGRSLYCPNCQQPLVSARQTGVTLVAAGATTTSGNEEPESPGLSLTSSAARRAQWPPYWPIALAAAVLVALAPTGYAYVQRQAALEAEERSRKATDDGWDRQELAELREELTRADLAPQLADIRWQMAEMRLRRIRMRMGLPMGEEQRDEAAQVERHAEFDLARAREDLVRMHAAAADTRGRVGPRIDKILARHPGWK
jgi:hypothetical protein